MTTHSAGVAGSVNPRAVSVQSFPSMDKVNTIAVSPQRPIPSWEEMTP